MTKREFDFCFRIADNGQSLENADDIALHGCALPGFQRVTVAPEAVAKFIRWHCMNLNGTWDSEALNGMRLLFRTRVDVVGTG